MKRRTYPNIHELESPDLWSEIERRIDLSEDSHVAVRENGPARRRPRALIAGIASMAVTATSLWILIASIGSGPVTIGSTAKSEQFLVRLMSPGLDPTNHTDLPSARASFKGEESVMWYDGKHLTWDIPDSHVISLPLVEFRRAIPAGTKIQFLGDPSKVTAHIGPYGGKSREGSMIKLRDGRSDRLPQMPGQYLLDVVGFWPQGSVGFALVITIKAH
jgi:hypothetical protein